MTKLSIVVPTKDRPSLLSRALRSVLSQPEDDFEVVVVNDGDEHPDVPDDRRVKVVASRRRGVAAARNDGVAAATGEFLMFLDDDDRYLPGRLDVPAVDVSVCKRHQNGRTTYYGWWPQPSAHVGQVTIRHSLCPPFDERFVRTEDVDWWLTILESRDPVQLPFVGYCLEDVANDRLSRTSRPQIASSVRLLLAKHPAWFAEHPDAAAFNWMRAGVAASDFADLWRAFRLSPNRRTMAALVRYVAASSRHRGASLDRTDLHVGVGETQALAAPGGAEP